MAEINEDIIIQTEANLALGNTYFRSPVSRAVMGAAWGQCRHRGWCRWCRTWAGGRSQGWASSEPRECPSLRPRNMHRKISLDLCPCVILVHARSLLMTEPAFWPQAQLLQCIFSSSTAYTLTLSCGDHESCMFPTFLHLPLCTGCTGAQCTGAQVLGMCA